MFSQVTSMFVKIMLNLSWLIFSKTDMESKKTTSYIYSTFIQWNVVYVISFHCFPNIYI